MKYEEYADSPISVSIFVEKGDAKTWYRICLEIKNTGADKKDMLVYHSHLDVPKTEGVQYVAGSNEKGNPKIITGSTDEIKKRLDSGEISKVQPCVYVEYSEDKTNSQYDDEIMAAVEKIIPYYEYVLKKKNSSKKSYQLFTIRIWFYMALQAQEKRIVQQSILWQSVTVLKLMK